MFSLNALIEATAQERNGKFNGVRIQLQAEEVPAEILNILDLRKVKKSK
jgi:hypothetical protein